MIQSEHTLQLNKRETTAGPDTAVVCFKSTSASPVSSSLDVHLMVGHRTTGRRRSTGRGATFAAFATRAFLLDFFLPGYWERKQLYTGATTLSEVRGELPGRSARGRSVACIC